MGTLVLSRLWNTYQEVTLRDTRANADDWALCEIQYQTSGIGVIVRKHKVQRDAEDQNIWKSLPYS